MFTNQIGLLYYGYRDPRRKMLGVLTRYSLLATSYSLLKTVNLKTTGFKLDTVYFPLGDVLACSIAIAFIASKELRLAVPSIALTAKS